MPIRHLQKKNVVAFLGGVSALTMMMSLPAIARADDEVSASAPVESSGGAIVVTATRRAELAKNVPVAVAGIVLTGTVVERRIIGGSIRRSF